MCPFQVSAALRQPQRDEALAEAAGGGGSVAAAAATACADLDAAGSPAPGEAAGGQATPAAAAAPATEGGRAPVAAEGDAVVRGASPEDAPAALLVDAAGAVRSAGAAPAGAAGRVCATGALEPSSASTDGAAAAAAAGGEGGARRIIKSLERSLKRSSASWQHARPPASPFDAPAPDQAHAAERRSVDGQAAGAASRVSSATSARSGVSAGGAGAGTLPGTLPPGPGPATVIAALGGVPPAGAATAEFAHRDGGGAADLEPNPKPGHVAAREGATKGQGDLPLVARGVTQQRLTGLLRLPFMRIDLEDGQLAVIEEIGCASLPWVMRCGSAVCHLLAWSDAGSWRRCRQVCGGSVRLEVRAGTAQVQELARAHGIDCGWLSRKRWPAATEQTGASCAVTLSRAKLECQWTGVCVAKSMQASYAA